MRMWEIRENSEYPKYGRRSPMRGYREDHDEHEEHEKEAYECGYEDGYRDAMKEAHYSERHYRKDRMD